MADSPKESAFELLRLAMEAIVKSGSVDLQNACKAMVLYAVGIVYQEEGKQAAIDLIEYAELKLNDMQAADSKEQDLTHAKAVISHAKSALDDPEVIAKLKEKIVSLDWYRRAA